MSHSASLCNCVDERSTWSNTTTVTPIPPHPLPIEGLFAFSLVTILGRIVLWPTIHFTWYGIDAARWGRGYARVDSA